MFLIYLKAAAVSVDREHELRGDLVILISKKNEWKPSINGLSSGSLHKYTALYQEAVYQ